MPVGELLATVSAVLFAAASILIRQGMTGGTRALDNGMLMTTSINVAAFGLLLVGVHTVLPLPTITIEGLAWFVGAGVLTTFLGRSSLYASIRHVGAARASGFKVTTPLFALAGGAIVLGEVISPITAIGIALTLAGVLVLTREAQRVYGHPDRLSERSGTVSPRLGSAFGIASAGLFGAGLAARKTGLQFIPSPLIGAFIGSVVGFASVALAFRTRRQLAQVIAASFRPVRWKFVLAGVTTSVAQLLGFGALALAPVATVATIHTTEPMFTALLAWLVLGRDESITAVTVLSLVVITGGIGVILVAP